MVQYKDIRTNSSDSEFPKTDFGDQSSRENFLAFIEKCLEEDGIDHEKRVTLQAMQEFTRSAKDNSETFTPFPNDDLIFLLFPEVQRMFLQRFENNSNYDMVMSSNVLPYKAGFFSVNEAVTLSSCAHDLFFFKRDGQHFFSSLGLTEKVWRQDCRKKLSEALQNLSEQILHTNLELQTSASRMNVTTTVDESSNSSSSTSSSSSNCSIDETKLAIYWIGCGFGEECILMSNLGKRFRIPLKIYATDYVEQCVNNCQRKIKKFDIEEIITASTKNVYTTEFIEEKYHVVYTSAVVEPLFSLKILYLALQCKTVQYLLWNHGHCEDVLKMSNN